MPYDLRLSFVDADRSCPQRTSCFRCRTDPARTNTTQLAPGWEGYRSVMADPDVDSADVLQRAEQAQAQSKALREQVALTAEAVAETEQEVARVYRQLADQGGPQAAEAREQAARAEEFAAKERAEAERLRRAASD
jgi:hypothetical protein